MKHLFRSHMIQLFRSRYHAAWAAFVVVAALVILLTSTTAYASTTPTLTGTTLPNAATFTCYSGFICVFSNTGFAVPVQYGSFPGFSKYDDLQGFGSWRTLSYINNGPYRVWLNQFTTGNHGVSYCMSPHSRISNITGAWDTDRWLLLTTNTAHC